VGKNSSIFNSKKLPKGFLIALVLILVFEISTAAFDNYFYLAKGRNPNLWFTGLRLKVKNSYSQDPDTSHEILVLGDCYNITGVIPQIIEKNTGLSCYNFSTYAEQSTFASYLLFNNYLKKSTKKPNYLIIGFLPFTLLRTKKYIMTHSMPMLFDFKEGNVHAFIKEFGIAQGLKLIVPSLKRQGIFKQFFKNPLKVLREIPNKKQLDNFIKQISVDKGHHVWCVKCVYRDNFKEENSAPNFEISNFNQKYLTKILELSRENNIKVIYLHPSKPPNVYTIYVKRGIVEGYEDFLNYLKITYKDIIDINPQDILNNNNMYVNELHLNGKGAEILSNFLSHIINDVNKKNLQFQTP